MITRAFRRLPVLLGVALVAITLAALLILLALVALPVTEAAGEGPLVVTIRGPVQNVSCGLGCCCGIVEGTYQGRAYGGAVCRWFRPLRDGDTVTKTGRPDANGWIK